MNRGFAGAAVFGNVAGRPLVSVREVDMGRGGGGGGRGGGFRGGGFQGGGFRGNFRHGQPFGRRWNGTFYEDVPCGPAYWGPECELPVVLGESERRRASLGAFEGISIDASIPDLCALLKRALASRTKSASETAEWGDFWDAMERLRPLEMSAAKWRADVMNQMATQCPDDVARLRSIPGARGISDKCVKVTIQKSPNQIISTVIEPYQTKGWEIVRIPFTQQLAVAEMQTPGAKLVQQYEIWACPPGQEIPKRTSLSAREAAELGHSLIEALAPLKAGTPGAADCVQGAHVDVAVVNRLVTDLEAKASANETIDVTQDQLDAANKVIDCASKAGASVTPPPAAATAVPAGAGGGFPWLPVAGVAGAGALALLVL